MPKKITIDELATMIKAGFDEQREYMDGRFSNQDKEIAEIKMKQSEDSTLLHRIDQRTHNQQRQLDEHELLLNH